MQTERALSGELLKPVALEPLPLSVPPSQDRLAAFYALASIANTYQIPAHYPQELLKGMRMDTENFRFRTSQDLELYCYRVASVVGLMMVHILGVNDQRALHPAAHTGLAMQMTNIARDVGDDFQMGRIYFPEQWFVDCGLTKPDVGDEFDPLVFQSLTLRLVKTADRHYQIGRAGLDHLPIRAALAVASAQAIYREIGIQVISRGQDAWKTRTTVSLGRKVVLLITAVAAVLWQRCASRLTGQRWRACQIDQLFTADRILS